MENRIVTTLQRVLIAIRRQRADVQQGQRSNCDHDLINDEYIAFPVQELLHNKSQLMVR